MFKKCFVPSCENNTKSHPKKLFLCVPLSENRRKEWFNALGFLNIPKTGLMFCCEDHFCLKNDAENWFFFKTIGSRLKLKAGVVPHLNISSNSTNTANQISGSQEERKIENVQKLTAVFQNNEELEMDPDEQLNEPTCSFFPENLKTDRGTQCFLDFTPHKEYHTVSTNTGPINTVEKSVSPMKATHNKNKKIKLLPHLSSGSSLVTTLEECSSFADTSSLSSDLSFEEYQNFNRKPSTVALIEKKSRFYLGLPQEVYCLVTFCLEFEKITYTDILITLKKIRTADVYSRLADDFDCSVSTVQRIFVKSVPIIANCVQCLVYFPNYLEVQRLLPIPFRLRYKKVQCIIDCFEIEIEKPSNPIRQAMTWSDYKKCNTIKILISSTPNGLINFVSPAYGGRASDKEIVVKSNFVNILPQGCAVMADRGFKQIDHLLQSKNCTLVRPPSVAENQILSKELLKESKRIAALRIHVERVIGRIREFAFLDIHSRIDNHLVYLLNHIVIIACAVVNLQGPLVKCEK